MALLRILRMLHCILLTIFFKNSTLRLRTALLVWLKLPSPTALPSSRKSVSAWMEDAARMLPVDWRQIVLQQSSQ